MLPTIRALSLLLAFTCVAVPVRAEDPSDAVRTYFDALGQRDYRAAARLFDGPSLGEFREMMSFVSDIPAQAAGKFFPVFFGAGATQASVKALSDVDFFAAVLEAVMARAEANGKVSFDRVEVLGEVMEGDNVAHVVTRSRMSAGAIELESMEVVSFRRRGDDWKALMSGKMKGVAQQLRAAFNRQ